jgi:hypothetical protein
MKGKIVLSVLFSLMLVFGMIIVSCDNAAYPADPYKDNTDPKDVKTAYDWDDDFRARLADGVYMGGDTTLRGSSRAVIEKLIETAKDADAAPAVIKELEKLLEDVKSGQDLIDAMIDGSYDRMFPRE